MPDRLTRKISEVIGLGPTLVRVARNGGYQLVANRFSMPDTVYPAASYAPASTWITGRSAHVVAVDCTALKVVYAGWYGTTDEVTDDYVTTPIKVAIEYPYANGGGIADIPKVRFGGSRTGSLVSGVNSFLESDPYPLAIPAGDTVYFRTGFNHGGTNPLIYSWGADPTFHEGKSADDGVDGNPIGDTDGVTLIPQAILGICREPVASVAIIGNSIPFGVGDTVRNRGFVPIALGSTVPWLKTARSSDTLGNWFLGEGLGLHYRGRMRLAEYCSHAVVMADDNDWAGGTAAATIQTYHLKLARELRARGIKAYVCTSTPRTTSTDSWATLGNQTVTASEAARVTLNTWKRAQPWDWSYAYPYAGVFDVAATVESGSTGKWTVGMTADGTHPNTAGHTAMAAAIDIRKFSFVVQ